MAVVQLHVSGALPSETDRPYQLNTIWLVPRDGLEFMEDRYE